VRACSARWARSAGVRTLSGRRARYAHSDSPSPRQPPPGGHGPLHGSVRTHLTCPAPRSPAASYEYGSVPVMEGVGPIIESQPGQRPGSATAARTSTVCLPAGRELNPSNKAIPGSAQGATEPDLHATKCRPGRGIDPRDVGGPLLRESCFRCAKRPTQGDWLSLSWRGPPKHPIHHWRRPRNDIAPQRPLGLYR
jgi:hypothetical protein